MINITEEFASNNSSIIQSAVSTRLFYAKGLKTQIGQLSLRMVALQKAIELILSFRLLHFQRAFLHQAKFLKKKEYPLLVLSCEMILLAAVQAGKHPFKCLFYVDNIEGDLCCKQMN